MKVVVIVPDRNITVDNRTLNVTEEDWAFNDSHIHAIHWNETSGELEYIDTSANEDLTTIDLVQPYIDKFFEELPRIERIRIQKEEESLAARESREQRMLEEEEEQNRILQKIRETAEENRRLRDQSRIAFEREQEAKRLRDEAEKKLAFQKEVDSKIAIRDTLDLEIASRVRVFDEEITQKTEQLKAVEEEIVSKQDNLEDAFNNKLADLFEQRGSMLSMIDDERAELDRQRREFLESKQKQDEIDAVMHEEMNTRSEAIKLEREVERKYLEQEREELESNKQRQVAFQEELNTLAQHQTDSYTAEIQEFERERQQNTEHYRIQQEQIQLQHEELELSRKQLDQEKIEFAIKERNLEKILNNEREIYEARLYEEKARLAADRLLDDHEKVQREAEAMRLQNEMVKDISDTSDPLTLFSVLDMDNFDVKNLPITEIMIFFSKLKRLQHFCKMYDLNWKQIQADPELQERIEEFLEEGILSPGEEYNPEPRES